MRLPDSLRLRIAALFRRSAIDAEMQDELLSHIQHRADDLERSGLPRAEAERRARVEFGGYQNVREECHEAAGGTFFESIQKDLYYALRVLRKAPGFTVVAVLTLALAIGANAVVFAALNAFVLRPLKVPRAESLYSVHQLDNSANQSYPDYVDYRDRNHSFEDLVAYDIQLAGLDTGNNPSRVWLQAVSGNYFDGLGIQPYLGRFFHASDEHGPNSAPYIVLGFDYWHSHFQADPNVIGRVVLVNKNPFTIIGVAPQDFRGTLLFFSPDFFLPLVNEQQLDANRTLTARGDRTIFMSMGHLKPGVTPEEAAADMSAISVDLEKAHPKEHAHKPLKLGRPSLYGDFVGAPMRAFLSALMILAFLILLAACANLGSLFAARAADRSREVALRLALGASRLRVLRQLFTESILISLAGGALGLWGGVMLLRWLHAWQPFPQFPINVPLSPDYRIYIVALLLSLASGFLFGSVPVRQVMRTDPYAIIKSGARLTHGRRLSGRDLLVVAQIAICAVLVTSSIVAVRGLLRSMHSNFGFDPNNVVLVDTNLDMAGYKAEMAPPMQKRMTEAVASIPGVTAVGLVDIPPLSNGDPNSVSIFPEDASDFRPGNAAAKVVLTRISPDYLAAAGSALLAGRNFTTRDDKDSPRVAIINPEFARRLFGSGASAIGRNFKMRDGTRIEVVGIVEQGKYQNLTENPLPAMFLPILQSPSSESWMVIRSGRDTQQLTADIKAKLHDLDSGLPSFIQTWHESLGLVLFPSRVATVALGVLGVMGAMLSITGIFGMAAYSVSKRMREFGIRMALGAQSREVIRVALGRAFKLLAFGSLAGLVLGILATRMLAVIVYQASPRDPLVLSGAVLSMALLGLLATWIPAQRALSVDPLVLLREE